MAREKAMQLALHTAAEVVGGREQLAKSLGISEMDLEAWIVGSRRPPQEVVLDALELATRYAFAKDLPVDKRAHYAANALRHKP
jgi:DNA-binding transcriptional regulator YdaS (Cro superfamily)